MAQSISASLGMISFDLDLDISASLDAFPLGTGGSPFGDMLFGTPGIDIFGGLGGNDTITGAAEDDTLSGGAGDDEIDGGDNADAISGGLGNDVILGGLGGDFILGDAGLDRIDAGLGPDQVFGGAGNDTILLGGGVDFGFGDAGLDIVSGGSETDILFGGADADELFGGVGDDVLFGGADGDLLDGGDDFDIASYSDATESVRIAGDAIGEVGTASVGTGWVSISFTETLTDASVVIGGIGTDDDSPVTARIRNVTDDGFEVRLEEWEFQDGVHAAETLHWIAVEAGTHTLESGLVVAAGSETDVDGSFGTVDFGTDFGSAPVVFSQVATQNETSAVVTRQRRTDNDSFQVSLDEEEAGNRRVDETVGWIAVEDGGSVAAGFLTGETPNSVTDANFTQGFGSNFAAAPVFLADMQSFDGGEVGTVRLDALGTGSATFFIEEDESVDVDGHTTEVVGYTALDAGTISGRTLGTADTLSTIGEAGTASVAQTSDAQWHSISFSEALTDAIVVMGPVTNSDGEEALTRVRNITDTGFEFQIMEWEHQDGIHALESVGWMALERGDFELADGRQISAGDVAANTGDRTETFGSAFASAPTIFTELNSDNDDVTAATRLVARDGNGFTLRLQEEQSNPGPATRVRAAEDVDWVAIGSGGSVADSLITGRTGDFVTHLDFDIDHADFDTTPVLLAQMDTTDGGDTANVRIRSQSEGNATIFVDEESSADSETNHTTENIGYGLFEAGLLFSATAGNTNDAEGDTYVDVERIHATELNDVLSRPDGVAEIAGGGGDDVLYGTAGVDIFVFADESGSDRIERFQDGVDLLDVSEHSAVNSFADILMAQVGDDVVAMFGGDIVLFANRDIALFDSTDFIFA